MAGPKALSNPDINNLKIVNLADGTDPGDGVNQGQLAANATADRSRANHTGTQNAATISDFDSQVRANRLDQMTAPTGAVSLGSQRATNLASASADTDAAQWGQVKDLISGHRKTDVRLVTVSNDTLSGLAARDGVTPLATERVLVTGQTTASANGIYLAAAGAWSRAADADASAEFATQWLVTVQEGTANGDTLWKHSTDAVVTLNTTSLVFTKIGPIASTASGSYTTTCPAVSAGATWTVTHNLGTRALIAQVARTGSPYDIAGSVRIERTTTNTVSVLPDVAMSSGEYEIMVKAIA